MAKGILCSEGLRLELNERAGRTRLSISWDDESEHEIAAEVLPENLFGVLNGMTYSISADPWTCTLSLAGKQISVAIQVDDFEVMGCGFRREDYEGALLTTFKSLRQHRS
jgi:hypothetical protein